MSKILVIWDGSHQKQKNAEAKEYFKFKLNSLDHPFFQEPDLELIDHSETVLVNYQLNKSISWSSYDGIIISLKLKWRELAGKYNGLEILSLIRENRIKAPVFMVTNDAKEEVYESKNLSLNLLKSPGSYLLSLDHAKLDLKGVTEPQSLSEKLLDDILYYCNNRTGIVEEILHRTKNRLLKVDWDSRDKDIYSSIIKEAYSSIQPCLPEDQLPLLTRIFNEVQEAINDNQLNPSQIFYQRKVEILSLLATEKDEGAEVLADWHVLFVDDDAHITDKVKTLFAQKGLTCHIASNADEAYGILNLDMKGELKDDAGKLYPGNSITILIADYRFENSLGEWDPVQGYDLIDYVHNQMHNTVSFFVLTSKKGAIMTQAKRNSRIRISWHAKDDVLDSDSSFAVFFDQVYEEGNKTYDALCGKPKTSSWHKVSQNITTPLKEYYRYYRNLGNYETLEAEINKDVLSYIEEVEYELSKTDNRVNTRIPEIEIDVNEIHFNTEFKAKIDGEPKGEDKNMAKFITKLKGRRIALALASEPYGFSGEQIINLLKFGKTDPDDEDYLAILNESKRREIEDEGLPVPKEEKQLLPTHLNLSKKIEKDIPYFILPEEINFLEQEAGVPILSRTERQKWHKINQTIEKACLEIYRSDPDKYKDDKFLEKPPKVYSERELKKTKEYFKKNYNKII
jgi:hypothetical protein